MILRYKLRMQVAFYIYMMTTILSVDINYNFENAPLGNNKRFMLLDKVYPLHKQAFPHPAFSRLSLHYNELVYFRHIGCNYPAVPLVGFCDALNVLPATTGHTSLDPWYRWASPRTAEIGTLIRPPWLMIICEISWPPWMV
jgi:hypothetical protein